MAAMPDESIRGVVLSGERVTLRPFRPDELDEVLRGREAVSDTVVGAGGGRVVRERLRRRIARSGTLHEGRLDLAIEVDGALAGDIDARNPPGAFPPGVYEIGIGLFDPTLRGRGYGREAVALITEHLFAALAAGRVQASTAVTNTAMRTVLERLGFREEGVMRSFMPGES